MYFLEENREYRCDLGMGKDFIETQKKIDTFGFIKI